MTTAVSLHDKGQPGIPHLYVSDVDPSDWVISTPNRFEVIKSIVSLRHSPSIFGIH